MMTGDLVRFSPVFFANMGAEMHPGAIPPDKPWLARLVLTTDEVDCGRAGFIVDGLHAFPR